MAATVSRAALACVQPHLSSLPSSDRRVGLPHLPSNPSVLHFDARRSGRVASIKQTRFRGSERAIVLQRTWFVCRSQIVELEPTAAAAAYGLTLLGGGMFSYARTGSKGSLFGGLTGGISLALAYYLMQTPETRAIGNAIGFGAAFLFVAIFGIRLIATRKVIPAGLLMGISIAALVVFFNAYFEAKI